MNQYLRTKIEGVEYQVALTELPNGTRRAQVFVVRKQEDGSEVIALLSVRQRVAEAKAKNKFAKEIADWMNKK